MKTINILNMKKIPISKYQRKRKVTTNYIGQLSNTELKKRIQNYEYLSSFLKFETECNLYSVDAIDLLSPINYDIFIKYLYFSNMNDFYIKKMYLKHIKVFNHYKEPDGSKTGKKDFLNSCKKLVCSYTLGFDKLKSIIPISNQCISIDGSHRIALSILQNENVICTTFETEDLFFDFLYFKMRGYPQDYLDLIGFYIIFLVKNISYQTFIFDSKKQKLQIIQDMYDKYDVYYYKIKRNKIIFLFADIEQNTYNFDTIFKEYSLFIRKKVQRKYVQLKIV